MPDSNKGGAGATATDDRDQEAGLAISVDDTLYLAVQVQARRLKRSDDSVFEEALRNWLTKTVEERPEVPGQLDESVRAFCRDLDGPAAVALADFLDALRQRRTMAAAGRREGAPREGRRKSEKTASP